ncbi:MAG: hypothetical protein WCV58_00985 [Patescibacteria group bacterium]
MKKNLIKIFAILFLVLLQLSLISKFSIFSFVPNIIFVVSIVLLLRGFSSDSFLVAVLGGFFLDLTSPFRFGFYTFILIIILLFLNFVILKNTPALNPILISFIILGIFIFIDLVICLITHTLPGWQIILDGVINSLWSLVVYFLLDKFIKKEEIKFSKNVNF